MSCLLPLLPAAVVLVLFDLGMVFLVVAHTGYLVGELYPKVVPHSPSIKSLHRFRYFYKKFYVKIAKIFLPISFNICFGCSKEPSH